MRDLDKWAADECDINTREYLISKGTGWTLNDARCREIVREHFGITTDQPATWIHESNKYVPDGGWRALAFIAETPFRGRGNYIAEAEIACIQAIKDAS